METKVKPLVYIETTIPSFYYEVRREPKMVAMRKWTREWWEHTQGKYERVTSVAVLEELARGGHPRTQEASRLMQDLPLLPVEDEIADIVLAYVRHGVMPRDVKGDALHLALASFHRCQFLLTWNCRHLANANKFERIRHVNNLLGLFTPTLVTPFELLSEEE